MDATRPIPILAADDEELILHVISATLEDGGYSVIGAATVNEAMAILSERISELGGLLTDINFGRDEPRGWEIARRARELNPNIPIVYMTGDSAHEWAAHGVPHSVLLEKPFASADLVVALANLRKID